MRYLLNLDEEIKELQTFDAAEKLLQRGDILSLTDVVLLDIELPGIDGIEATARIKRTYPAIDILILTIFEEREKIVRAINAGASGYILKNDNTAELVRAGTADQECLQRGFTDQPSRGKEAAQSAAEQPWDEKIVRRLSAYRP